MLQSLLEDRFKLIFHSATKELPLYELVVGKNGHKLKASVEDPAAAAAGPDPGPGRGGPPPIGKDGFPTLPPAGAHAHDVQRRPSSYRRQRPIHD
jgi:uncharacterized protein (TIGR03435 family)